MRLGSRRGIALIAVLWVVTLLAVVAASFTTTTRTETKLARNALDNAKARALADAGVHRAVLALLDPKGEKLEDLVPAGDGNWWLDGVSRRFAFGEGEAWVSVHDEGGKIDINRAPDALLGSLLRSAGLDDDTATALVDAIADFRDPDDLVRLNGAEDDEYRAAGLPHEAKDKPFEAVEELRQVIGMTPELYRAVAPFLTTHSRRGKIDLMTAPREVLLAVPGVDPNEVEALLADRAAIDGPIGRSALTPLTGARGYFSLSSRRVFTVRAQAHTDNGAVFVREAVVRLTRNPEAPFRFLAWKQGLAAVIEDSEAR